MPQKTTDIKPEPETKIEKECPKCHSTMWQGPFNRGNIINGELVVRESLYNCVNCHAVLPVSEMVDRVTLAAGL